MLNILKCVAVAALLGASASAKDAVLPRDGDYLSTAYIAVLDKTKSHYKAWRAAGMDAPQAIRISRDKRNLVVFIGYNWHEGNEITFEAKNTPTSIEGEPWVRKSFFPIDAMHFRFKDGQAPLTAYRYVGVEQSFLAEKLLVGAYADAHGHRYVFGADGKAQFPDRTFRYELYLDMVFEDCDLVSDVDVSKPGSWKAYGFARKGDALFLYNTDCNVEDQPGCVVDRTHPIAVLHKVAPKK